MVEIAALWLPIIVAAALVFIISSIIHMATPWHKGDYKKLPNEEKTMDVMRPLDIPPGEYMVPCPSSTADLKTPEFLDKLKKGPVMMMSVWPNGPSQMGKSLLLWFLYSCVVGFFAAYVSGRALSAGATYLQVFRFVGTTSFLSYSLALCQFSIWYHRPWGTTIRSLIDGLIYGLVTAGVFGWLWPR